jgi:hypothetical protein
VGDAEPVQEGVGLQLVQQSRDPLRRLGDRCVLQARRVAPGQTRGDGVGAGFGDAAAGMTGPAPVTMARKLGLLSTGP